MKRKKTNDITEEVGDFIYVDRNKLINRLWVVVIILLLLIVFSPL